MAGPLRQIVHVWLEILDDTTLVSGRKKCSRMGELHCADGGIMGLQNGLEVECQPIPQCELTARGACQYSSRFWCPLGGLQRWVFQDKSVARCTDHDTVDRTSDLVGGCMHELSTQRR